MLSEGEGSHSMQRWVWLVAVAVTASAAPALAAGCEKIAAAQIKGLTTPVRNTFTFTLKGNSVTFSSITADGRIYSHAKDGSWKVEYQNTDATRIHKNWDSQTCTADGSEVIGGDITDIFLNPGNAGGIRADAKFWVSETTGLIMKTETDLPDSTLVGVSDYTNVDIPDVPLQQ